MTYDPNKDYQDKNRQNHKKPEQQPGKDRTDQKIPGRDDQKDKFKDKYKDK